MQTGLRIICDARKHIGKPCFGIDVVEARGHDDGVHDGGSLGTAIGSREQPCLRLRAKPRRLRSAALLVRQIRPSSTNRAKPSQRFSI